MNEDEGIPSGSHIPDFAKKVPFYYNNEKEGSLDHQKIAPYAQPVKSGLNEYYKHGTSKNTVNVVWKPGCCKNCGSNTHTEFECTERPRKLNARITGVSKAVPDMIQKKELSYEAKRDNYASLSNDRWFMEVRKKFNYQDRVRAQANPDVDHQIHIEEEFGNRGFRNREDRAHYLQNLDSNKPVLPDDDDMWVKSEANKDPKLQMQMSWEKDAQNIKDEANAKIIEQQHNREFLERKAIFERQSQIDITQFEQIPKSNLYGHLEDQYIHGHKSVWGSYFNNGKWGYACCHQTSKDTYCTSAQVVNA